MQNQFEIFRKQIYYILQKKIDANKIVLRYNEFYLKIEIDIVHNSTRNNVPVLWKKIIVHEL